jgi:hypothetical protein
MAKGKKANTFTINCKVSKDPWTFKVKKCEVVAPSGLLGKMSFPSSAKKVSSNLRNAKVKILIDGFPKSKRFQYVNREVPLELLLTFPHWPKEKFSNLKDMKNTMEMNSKSLILFDNFQRRELEMEDLLSGPVKTLQTRGHIAQ